MTIEDDDDLFAPRKGADLGALLDLPTIEAPKPPPAIPPAPAPGNVGTSRPGLSAGRASRSAASSEPVVDAYGEPGSGLADAAKYALFVHAERLRRCERSTLLRRALADDQHLLDEACAALGRAAHEASEGGTLQLPKDALDEVRAALAALDALAAERAAERAARAARSKTAEADRAATSRGLSPVEFAQQRALEAMEGAAVARERRTAELVELEARFAEAISAGADAMREADRAIDAARNAARAADAAHRQASLTYAEARRRAIREVGMLAAAERAVEGLAIEERRAAKEAHQREDQALRRLREAYTKLGARTFDEGLVAEAIQGDVDRVRSARASRQRIVDTADALERTADGFHAEVVQRGRLTLGAACATFVVLLGLVAAFA